MSKTLNEVLQEAFQTTAEDEKSHALKSDLREAMSPHSLCNAFRRNDSSCTGGNIDMESMEKAFRILSCRSDLCEIIADIIFELYTDQSDLGNILCEEEEDSVTLRILPILILCPVLSQPNKPWSCQVVEVVGKGLLKLKTKKTERFNTLVSWLKVETGIFKRAIAVFKCHCDLCKMSPTCEVPTPLLALSLLNEVNEAEGIVPCRYFHMNFPDVHTPWHFDMFVAYVSRDPSSDNRHLFTWLDYPFALNTVSKWLFLLLETFRCQFFKSLRVESQDIFQEAWTNLHTNAKPSMEPCPPLPGPQEGAALGQQLQELSLVQRPDAADTQVLHLGQQIPQQIHRRVSVNIKTEPLIFEVDRDRIVKSTMENIRKYLQEEKVDSTLWLRPLWVNFKGEYAVDLGGPSKEFFYLLFKELTNNDKYKFFKRVDNGQIFFNEECEQPTDMEAIGILFGLMIYNRVIVKVPFPTKVYEKLLSPQFCPFSLDDLELVLDEAAVNDLHEMNCELDSLRMLADLNVLCGSFVRGFVRCFAPMQILRLFKPDEFQALVLGGKLDWRAFEKETRYAQPYSKDHKVIIRFWKVFHSLQEEDRKRFLRFLTCCERVPLNGFKALGFKIRRLDTHQKYNAEPEEIMPLVYTCPGYISMDLPEYKCEEDLEERLLMAMTCEGFHREVPRQEPEQQLARIR